MRFRFLLPSVATLLVVGVSLAGCNSDSTDTTTKIEGSPPPLETDEVDMAAGHPTEGPHGGHLIELGDEEYHVELMHDDDTHTVTIHLLDSTGKESITVPLAEITLQLFQDGEFVKYALAAVQEPENSTEGASRFEIIDAALCDALGHSEQLRGRLHVTIEGKMYTGTIEHAAH